MGHVCSVKEHIWKSTNYIPANAVKPNFEIFGSSRQQLKILYRSNVEFKKINLTKPSRRIDVLSSKTAKKSPRAKGWRCIKETRGTFPAVSKTIYHIKDAKIRSFLQNVVKNVRNSFKRIVSKYRFSVTLFLLYITKFMHEVEFNFTSVRIIVDFVNCLDFVIATWLNIQIFISLWQV